MPIRTLAAVLALPWFLPAADKAHLLSAGLLEWDALLLRQENEFHSSAFAPLEGLGHVRIGLEASTIPTFHRGGASPAELYSESARAGILAAPNSKVALGFGGAWWRWRHAIADTGRWDLEWQASRQSLPLSLYVRGDSWQAMAAIADGPWGGYDGAFRFQGPAGRWSAEVQAGGTRHEETLVYQGRDADSTPRSLGARIRGEGWHAGLHLARNLGPGRLEAKSRYARSRPRTGSEGYQASDSSQSLELGLAWIQGRWRADWEFSESQSFSFGRRFSETGDVKRFHHALGHAYLHEAGLHWGRGPSPGKSRPGTRGWRLGARHRYYLYRNDPHPDAFLERKESLSYNRLESSFLASAYGGFHNSHELASLRAQAQVFELRPAWNTGSGRRWYAEASLPMAWMDLRLRFRDETVTRSLVSSRVERVLAWGLEGPAVMACPTLDLNLRLGPFSAGLRAAQSLPVWDRLRNSSGGGAPGKGDGDSRAFRNGFLLESRAGLDF